MIISQIETEAHLQMQDPASAHSLFEAYAYLESMVKVNYILDKVTYTAPVNFTEASKCPRHRWFPYKEGFSPKFVRETLNRFLSISTGGIVLDPFSGVGTTLIEASRNGHNAFGLDVSPLAVFVATTKALDPSKAELKRIKEDIDLFVQIELQDRAVNPENATVCSYFETEYLDALLKIKAFASSRECSPSKSLFMLAFLTVIERFSTHRKAGNGVKKKTRLAYRGQLLNPMEQVKLAILNLVSMYFDDIKSTPLDGSIQLFNASSLDADLPNNTFDCLLTSPPYANCFDYSKIYLSELWLGDFFSHSYSQKSFRVNSVRSHVHARWAERYTSMGSKIANDILVPLLTKQELWSKAIPQMLSGYFADLGQLLSNTFESLRSGAKVGFVVSNSAYGGLPVATDILLCEIGKTAGYVPEEIIVYRNIVPSSQQYIRITEKKYLRESLVILRKP